jgi:hypothetical protein
MSLKGFFRMHESDWLISELLHPACCDALNQDAVLSALPVENENTDPDSAMNPLTIGSLTYA